MSVKQVIKQPEPFCFEQERWDSWKSRFIRYLKVSDQSGKSDEEKIDLLVYIMGGQAEDIYNEFSNQKLKFDQVVKLFDDHFNPRKKIWRLKTSFHKRRQEEGEPIEQFITDLQTLANQCKFDNTDDLVQGRILAGMRDAELSNRLQLKDDLNLDETISIVAQAERNECTGRASTSLVEQKLILSTSIDHGSDTSTSEETLSVVPQIKNNERTDIAFKNVIKEEQIPSTSIDQGSDRSEETIAVVPQIENNEHTGTAFKNVIKEEQIPSTKTYQGSNKRTWEDFQEPDSTEERRKKKFWVLPNVSFACEEMQIVEELKLEPEAETLNSVHPNYLNEDAFPSEDSINHILNDGCLLNIFSYLPVRDLIKIERVCKKWRRISLEAWSNVKVIDVRNDFKIKSIRLKYLEEILRRSGEHITRLDCDWRGESKQFSAKASMDIINKYCKKLIEFQISYGKNQKNYLDVFDVNKLMNLKSLAIGNCKFHDDQLSLLLKNAVNVEEFALVGYNSSENKFENLSQKCKTLSITYSKKLTNEILQKVIETHPNIENLDVTGCNVTPSGLVPFKNQFKCLSLWEMNIFFKADIGDYCLLKCPNLRILDLNYNDKYLTGDILSILIDNCPEIEDLRLRSAKCLKKKDFDHLKKLKKLKYLDVSYTKITNTNLIEIAEKSMQLKKLFCIGCNSINESGLNTIISASPFMTYLAVTCSKITKSLVESILRSLSNRPNRESLTISPRSVSAGKIPDVVKKLELKDGIDTFSKPNVLRIVSGTNKCECSFYETCSCLKHEETLVYIG